MHINVYLLRSSDKVFSSQCCFNVSNVPIKCAKQTVLSLNVAIA